MDSDSDDDEDAREQLAQGLVTAALRGYKGLLSTAELADIRDYLVDELLCTSYGRARLKRLGAMPSVDASAEIVREHEILSQLKKEGSSS